MCKYNINNINKLSSTNKLNLNLSTIFLNYEFYYCYYQFSHPTSRL